MNYLKLRQIAMSKSHSNMRSQLFKNNRDRMLSDSVTNISIPQVFEYNQSCKRFGKERISADARIRLEGVSM